MNTEPPVVPVSEETPAEVIHQQPRLLLALGGVLVLLGMLAGGWYLYDRQSFLNTLPDDTNVDVVLGIVPIGEVFSFEDTKTLGRVVTPVPGMQVIDRVQDGTITYYLLGDPATRTSNLYKEEGGMVSVVTTSATLKFDLSFDPISKTFAYLSGEVASTTLNAFASSPWKLTLFSETSGERTLVGAGHHPVLLPGATHLLIGNAEMIERVEVKTGARQKLLSAASDAPFAVSEDGATLALLNRTTNALDYFSVSGGSLSYVRSQSVTRVPLALAFADDSTLLMASVTEDRSSIVLSIVGGATQSVSSPTPGLIPHKIIISYE